MILVFNASPVIVLAKAGLLEACVSLGNPAIIPQAVVDEALRHKGRLPLRLFNKPKIIRKWEFVERMAGRISKSW